MNSCFLADAGLVSVAFFQAVVLLIIAGIGIVFGVSAVIHTSIRPKSGGISILLGALGLAAVFAYAGCFWSLNGDGAWEHACHNPGVHYFLAGLPFLSSASAIAISLHRWKWSIPDR